VSSLYISGVVGLDYVYRFAPYERRVVELLRNNQDKRARRLAKRRVWLNYFCAIIILKMDDSLELSSEQRERLMSVNHTLQRAEGPVLIKLSYDCE